MPLRSVLRNDMKLLYTGPVFDSSGYAQFARNFIIGLDDLGVDIKVNPVSFEIDKSDLGEVGQRILKKCSKDIRDRNVHIINLTPEHFHKFTVPGAINIGFTVFETTRIPDLWVQECNKMDAIFVPCSWNVKIFKNSGVTVPIKNVPGGIYFTDTIELLPELDALKDKYKFYSIFQWTERKNPIGLLKSYYAAFTGRDDVVLVLKTYGSNTSPQEQQRIKGIIHQVKADMRLKHYPPILFIGNLLSTAQIRGLHAACDCFVLPHRAEGFGMPHIEAMSFGNPIITTGFSGNMEFCTEQNSYLVNASLTPVCGMPWIPWYEGDMLWGEPDLSQVIDKMRYVVDHREEAKKVGARAREDVLTKYSHTACAERLVQAIKELA